MSVNDKADWGGERRSHVRVGVPSVEQRGDQEPDDGGPVDSRREGHSALKLVGGELVTFDKHSVQWAWWATGSWRDREAEKERLRRENPQCARCYARLETASSTCPNGCAESHGPHPLLRIANPACKHDRCAETIMACPECKHYTDTHWGDPISLGVGRSRSVIE